MPLYEYRCESCLRVFEAYKRPSDDASAENCPACGGRAARMGISLFSAKSGGSGAAGGRTSCGGGSRRSPFS
ncbi:MAG: FmdB family zinc ribbon protein [Gemmatimonadota bacterium]